MPTIGGVNIGWDSNSPTDTESAGLGDDRIRSLKTSVQQAFDAEHYFPVGGGANTGYHVLGSARPYFGAQSLVSSTGSDARLMVTSDSSRLFGVGSAGTVFYGGATVISAGSYPGTVPQRHYWAMEFGEAKTIGASGVAVSFPNSGYSGLPFITLTAFDSSVTRVQMLVVNALSETQMTVRSFTTQGTTASDYSFFWQSIGTRVL